MVVLIMFSGIRPITLMKCPVRSCMQGVVGAGGDPRLPDYGFVYTRYPINNAPTATANEIKETIIAKPGFLFR